jgi:hypothetical protein
VLVCLRNLFYWDGKTSSRNTPCSGSCVPNLGVWTSSSCQLFGASLGTVAAGGCNQQKFANTPYAGKGYDCCYDNVNPNVVSLRDEANYFAQTSHRTLYNTYS